MKYITTSDPFYSERLEKMVRFSYGNFGLELGIPKATIHLKATTPDKDGITWAEEREQYFKTVRTDVKKKLAKKEVQKEIKRNTLIDNSETMITQMTEQVTAFFDKFKLKVDDQGNVLELPFDSTEIISLIKALEMAKKNYAKLIDLIDTGSKKIIFNINVPPRMLTAEGRDYVSDLINNPKKIVDAEFEVEE